MRERILEIGMALAKVYGDEEGNKRFRELLDIIKEDVLLNNAPKLN